MKDKEKEKEEKKPPNAQEPPDESLSGQQEQEPGVKEQELLGQIEEQKQQYLRVLAEYDNYRKRTAAEKTAIYNNAVSDTVQAILPIADNIGLALSQENASGEDMRKGVEMIEAQIKAAFEKLGIEETGVVGENFDPNLHNAVAHIEDEDLGENVISAVFQKGYTLGGRVVRHAMVQVAN